jgi:glycosyltransferase involved in cell wall biosynthesis
MRIVIDMQGAQTASRFRSIGHYTIALTQAIVRNRGEHEVILALNGLFPDTIEPIRGTFDGLLPQENIRVWYAAGPVRECEAGSEWRRNVAERIREAFLTDLRPDVVHVTSLFEGYVDDAVISIGEFAPGIRTLVNLYHAENSVKSGWILNEKAAYRKFRQRKTTYLERACRTIRIVDAEKPRHDDDEGFPFSAQGFEHINSSSTLCLVPPAGFNDEDGLRGSGKNQDACWTAHARKVIEIYEEIFSHEVSNTQQISQAELARSIAASMPRYVSERYIASTAHAIALNHPMCRQKKIYIDISDLVQKDLRTGIQRVTRSILCALQDNPPENYLIEPVYASQTGVGYSNAQGFVRRQGGGLEGNGQKDNLIEPQPGDIFLGLDFVAGVVTAQQEYLEWMRNHGVRVYFIVYDLLPVKMPHAFPSGADVGHQKWLEIITSFDGAICISRAIADELQAWQCAHGAKRLRPLEVGWFHLGADVENSVPTKGLPGDADQFLDILAQRTTFLMVGTIEPRKGHFQALAALDLLWQEGADVNFVVVGKQGWMMEELASQLRAHAEVNKRLFWLEGISDEYLEKIYGVSTCLIAASEAEGFGLPLIEAAQHGLPIIARDIPVFREVATDHAFYFEGVTAGDLRVAIRRWMDLHERGAAPKSTEITRSTWKQSAMQLLENINLHPENA